MPSLRPNILSIAGFDPSAGAGILADIKTFENHKVYGYGVVTGNTMQNDCKFTGVAWCEMDIIISQLELLFEKYDINFVKIGLIQNLETLVEIVNYLKAKNETIFIIWDPILKASAGFEFHSVINQELLENVLKSISLITPNLEEFKRIFAEYDSVENLSKHIKNRDLCSVLVKGGHSENRMIVDSLLTISGTTEFKGKKFSGYGKHGTGCVLSSAIAANLANGFSLTEACSNAKKYVEKFIKSNDSNLGYHVK